MTKTGYRTALNAALLASVSMLASSAVLAQDDLNETIVVTGSRISRPGFTAPTPVTAVSAADLAKSASTVIGDVLNQLPQFGGATSSRSGFQGGGNAGASFLNLRNLGQSRTLVLLNGQRVVSSTLSSVVDLNTLPQTLVSRVDVVTGGASAAWGADAVAGVVNFVLNTAYEGVKGSIQYGNTTAGTYEGYNADVSVGTSFAGDRGHFLTAVSYYDNPNFLFLKQAKWFKQGMLMLNPAYTATNAAPRYIHAYGVGLAQATPGGLITAGPLKNTQFVGPEATPAKFNPGNVSGTLGYGGDNDHTILDNDSYSLPQLGYNFFTYASYRLTSNITAHVDVDHGYDGGISSINPYLHNANITIRDDNPFIPAQTKAAMTAAKITSFQFGSLADKIGNIKNGGGLYDTHRTLQRGTLGLDGTFGNSWSWNAYVGHGEVHSIQHWINDPYIPFFNNAVDAVAAPAGNAAGIAPGTTVCRSTLTDPTNGCQPLNLFGTNRAPDAVIKYIQPDMWQQINNTQDVAAASIQGDLLDNWAGTITGAGGIEARSESTDGFADAYSISRQSYVGNSQPFHGAVSVYEAFAEVDIPMVKNEWWAQDLGVNAAGRVTSYSTSGVVETWKLGVSDQVNDEFRLRGTWSADIRAPTMSDLFTTASSGGRVVSDPFTSICQPTTCAPLVLNTNTGNRNLRPESGRTISGGIIYTPSWLQGLSLSADWYAISIGGAIASISQENELLYCFQGKAEFCSLVKRNAAGTITEIVTKPTNTGLATNSGLDVEAQYLTDFWRGDLNLHGVANYTDETTTTQNGVTLSNGGSISANTLGGAGRPKFRATLTATYNQGPYSATIQSRIISSALLNNMWGPKDVDNNAVPWVAYGDVRGSYNITENYQAFFAVDNVFNTPPPEVPYLYTQSGQIYRPMAPGDLYDLQGRSFRIGLRVNF